jgi:chemotaxis protein CheD
MAQLVVGIADCKVSRDPADELVTYALGSCIAVAVYDPLARIGGMLHFMLPEAASAGLTAERPPAMFADTGVPLLIERALALGADKKRLVVRAAGGAQVMDPGEVFNIGKRNQLALKKVMWKTGVFVQAEDVGGTVSRTVRLELGGGRMFIRMPGAPEYEMPMKGQARPSPIAALKSA